MKKKYLPENTLKFLLLITITIIVTYKVPKIIAILWYLMTLVMYYRSKDEAFWLVFFFVTVDGFFGLFGVYTVTITVIPGMPSIELVQVYILLSLFKAFKNKYQPYIFYRKYIIILSLYIIFLIIWGQIIDFKGESRDYFRILKLTMPFALFYSIPKLFSTLEHYKRFFTFIFIVLIGAFITRIFVILTGVPIIQITELSKEQFSEIEIFRGFHNAGITLMGLFGALFFMTQDKNIHYNKIYLYFLIIVAYGMVYMSATRGWIISFSFITLFSFLFVPGIRPKKISEFFAILIIIVFALSNEKLKKQVDFASERLQTLQSIAEGDITAEGTLSRLSYRGPEVMKKFFESPFFGWGISDTFRKFNDTHVGNQNLLMFSGAIGFVLLTGFLFYFSFKLLLKYWNYKEFDLFTKSLPLFAIFLLGWFIIHSTSSQQFSFITSPVKIIPQVIFFSFGAFIYSNSNLQGYD